MSSDAPGAASLGGETKGRPGSDSFPHARPGALLVDYGGVLTSSLSECLDAFCTTDALDPADLQKAIRDMSGDAVSDLETGRLSIPDFEERLAARLRTHEGRAVPAPGLLTRMFAGFVAEPAMIAALRTARRHGIRTALVSNSWGLDYPRHDWVELFDAVVISGEVGVRKPEPEIYLLAAASVGVAPPDCVFVDDLPVNVRGAVAVGMCGVHHVDQVTTLADLEAIFGVPLSAAFPAGRESEASGG